MMTKFLKKLFLNYIWVGLFLILIAVIIDLKIEDGKQTIFYSTIINTIQTIGIAILISAIFSWISGTSTFIEKIRSLL